MRATLLTERVDAYPTGWISGFAVRPGRALPFGATPVPGGVNFSVYSNHATAITLVLFRRGEREPMAELPIPQSFRVGGVYSMVVFGLDMESTEYGYRADGPFDPVAGHRFDPGRVLADPYARAFGGREVWGVAGWCAGQHPAGWGRGRQRCGNPMSREPPDG